MFVMVSIVAFLWLNSDRVARKKWSVGKASFEDRTSEDPPKAVIKRVLR